MSTPIGIIKKLVDSLTKTTKTGTEAVDEALKNFGINGGYAAFLREFEGAKSGLSQQDFLEQKCGVRLNNKDTGAITGSDAGGKTTKTVDTIIPETAAAKELTDDEYNSFTKNGLTVNIQYVKNDSPGENFGYDGENYLAKQKLVVKNLYNWWLPEALDLINESLGINFTDGRASVNEIDIKFVTGSLDYYNTLMRLDTSYDVGRVSTLTLNINANYLYKLADTDKNGDLSGNGGYNYLYSRFSGYSNGYTNYLDRLFLQAFTEMALDANLYYPEKLPQAIPMGLWQIVGGYDDKSTDYYTFYYNYSVGYNYAVLRYLAKNYSDGTPDDELPEGLSYNSSRSILTASTKFTGTDIDLADFDPLVKTVDASALRTGVNITGNESANSLKGGSGADTLNGSSGNDTLTGGGGSDVFIYEAGNDVITDYASGDEISLGTDISDSSVKGSDVVFTIGRNTLTVKNGLGKTLSLIDSYGDSFTTIIGGGSSDELMLDNSSASPVTLDSGVKVADASSRTKAIKITGNTAANTIIGGTAADTLYGGAGNDSLYGGNGNDKLFGDAGADTLNGGSGNDTLTGGAGNDVFIYEAGNDVITDYTTGDEISFSVEISDSSVKGSDVVFIVGRNTLTVKDGADKTLRLVDSYGDIFTTIISGGSSDVLTLNNSSTSPVTLDSDIKTADASSRTKAIKITGNTAANSIIGGTGADTLYGGSGNDSLYGGNGNDKLYGDAGIDTLNGGSGNDTLTGGAGNDVFIYEAGNDVIADYATGDKISLGAAISKSSVKGSDVVFTIGKNTLTVKDGVGKTLKLIDSAGKSSTTIIGGGSSDVLTLNNSSTSPATLASGVKTADASKRTKAIQITGNTAANSIVGGTGADTLYGGSGNDTINGGNGNDKLYGDAGADKLYGGNGNDTLTGGAGNDVFIYDAGNDVIADYAAGDKISLGAAISKSSVKGSDVVFTIGRNTLTVKDGAGKSLSLIDSAGKSSSTIIGGSSDELTLDNSSNSPVTLDSDVKIADASTRTKAIKIFGNALANSIVGGSGADTLYGGTGNDSLWGNKGADTFLYFEGEGKDVIYGFENSDMLLITGAFSASYNKSKKELAFKVGSTANALTLKDFTATTFNINGFDYSISGSTLKRK